MRILIVEDDHKIANALKKGFEQESFAVDVSYDGQDGFGQASTIEYDLIILDRMLPGMDGMEICQRLRDEKTNTPILMLTAKDKISDRVDGLKRETKEELSVEIEDIKILTVCVDEYGFEKGDFFTLNLFYKCKMIPGEIKLDSENSEFKWFSEEDIPWGELAFMNTEIALKKLYNLE